MGKTLEIPFCEFQIIHVDESLPKSSVTVSVESNTVALPYSR
jgi:hypothetical protein